jgi:hypothetical protein
MKSVNNNSPIEPHHLPERLKSQFSKLKARLWRVELALGAAWGIFAVLVSFLTAFVLDRWQDTPSLIRGGLLLGALAAICLSGGWWCWRWIIAERNLRDYSRLVQRQYRILGDRLLGIVELTEDNSEDTSYSEELYQAAVQQVDLDARGCDFTAAVSTRLLTRLGIGSGILILITFILLAILPGAFSNTLSRWINPGGGTPRYTLVTIQPDTNEHLAIRGESFVLEADVNYLSFWKPNKVTVQLDSGYQVLGEVQDNRISLEIPGQFKETSMQMSVGDGSAESKIKPMQRPTLVSLSASIQMPAYLNLPDTSVDIESGGLDILKGSEVQFTGSINRSLNEIVMNWGSMNQVPVTISNATFTTEWLATTNAFEASINWTDQYGFTNAQPWNLNIRQRDDMAPTFQFPELYREMAILETEALELKTEVRDDFGVKEFGINWETINGVKPSKDVLDVDFKDYSLHAAQKELRVSFYFSPNLYNIEPGDVVELRGFVTDYYPDREPGQTAIYRIHIVSAVEHAERIRQQLEALLTQLEDVSRLEQSIATATDETLEKMDTLSEEDLAARLQDQATDQKLNASQLSEMARKGMETLKEAMRNPTFTDEVMSEWSKTLSEMQQLADQKMQEAAKALSQASQSPPSQSPPSQSPPSQSQSQASKSAQKQAMQEAQEKEQEILDSLEQLQAMVNEDLDQLQALTLAQRLRGLGRTEMDLETTLMDGAEDTIGLFPDELAPRWRALHDKLGDTQKETAEQSQELQDEIGRFFERTQKEAYGEVSEDMKAKQTVESIITTQELILKNITMEAADQVANWSKQFEEWASQLEPQDDSEGSGGGEGGGESNQQDLTKQLMALLRMRESELNLRMQTRLLERQNAEPEIRVEKGRELSTNQTKLQEDLLEVREEIPIPFLDPIFEEIHGHMGNAADALARGQTDDRAVEPETKSITTLTDAINILNEQAQQSSSSSSSSSQAMSFMMQMMMAKQGMGQEAKGNTGGGSMAGGDTDRDSVNQGGADDGDAGESRSVSRGSGQAADLPTEFRKSFEAYYKKLEQLEQPNPTNEGIAP